MTVKELLEKIRRVDVETLKELAVEENSVYLAKLNAAQMRRGLNAEGQPIRPKYSEPYFKRKKRMGYSLDGTPDLYLTGEFQRQMDTTTNRGEYHLTSFDEKVKFLPERYDKIFGLTPDNIEPARAKVTETFVSLYKKETGLNS